MLIQVALPVPFYSLYDYLIPEPILSTHGLPPIGARVIVPFGKGNRRLIGIVITHLTLSQFDPNQLKSILEVIDNTPILDEKMLLLAKWLSTYYHFPLGSTLAVMLPTLINQGRPLTISDNFWRILPKDTTGLLTSPKQKQQFAMIELHNEFNRFNHQSEIAESQLLSQGVEKTFLRKFEEKGLVESFSRLIDTPRPPSFVLNQENLPLNDEQQTAVSHIHHAIKNSVYQGFLLNGVTGSGKTEVYLQAMQPTLEQGKQVLILVPEIGLTPQTERRFSERFNANVLMIHSGLSDTVRLQGWQACRTGQAQIVIATRSGVLYQFADLGLIIVDESHDLSYKQQDTLRYHATDVALYRGFVDNIPVILGTATPSLESLQLVTQKKLTELRLTKRAGNASPALFRIIDARQQKWQNGLTQALINEMGNTLAKNEQVLVFLNRRGYAPILLCDACGWQADCPRCDAHLTVHFSPVPLLKCHHCDWQNPIPKACPECGSVNLDPIGMGTARMVEGLGELFPDVPIIQIDRDTTRRKDSWENLYRQIEDNPAAILVGTQMVAKGHHFPNVTLVAMPNADRGFLSSDFRSPEHTAQLLVQVAGRAGRADKTGQVLIQTLQPENPALLTLIKEGYQLFAEQLLQERRLLGLPPFTYACLVRVEGKSLANNRAFLQQALALLQNQVPSQMTLTRMGIAISGIVDAPMAKKNNRFHSQVLILGKSRSVLHGLLDGWWERALALPSAKYLRIALDIDPSGWG